MSSGSKLDTTAPALEHSVESPAAPTGIGPSCDNASPAATIGPNRERRRGMPDFKIASSRHEWRAALGLVYRAYVRSGLIGMNGYRMRVTPFHVMATTEVLIAVDRDEVLSTLSIVGDGRLGLPMETIYSKQIARRRRQGIRLAEVSCLAYEQEGSQQSFAVVARLMALAVQCATYRGLDQLLIAVHPRHARFYERFIAFEMIGGRKTYGSVRNHPAVAMALDLNGLRRDHPRAYERLFGVPFAADVLEHRPIPPELRADLQMIAAETRADQSPVLACA